MEGMVGQLADDDNEPDEMDLEHVTGQADQVEEEVFHSVSENNIVWWNDEVLKPEMVTQCPCFEMRKDLLYWVVKGSGEGEENTQLLVSQGYWRDLMSIVHSLPTGDHLGCDKMGAWLLKRFFWLGIYREGERFCNICPVCQKVSQVFPEWATLMPMPVIEKPFN